jgi:hypothetical protein
MLIQACGMKDAIDDDSCAKNDDPWPNEDSSDADDAVVFMIDDDVIDDYCIL